MGTTTHNMVFTTELNWFSSITSHLPSEATIMADVKAAAGGLQSIEESTNTGSAAACNASVTALDGKVRSHLGGAAFASEAAEKFGKDPVTFAVKKYLTLAGCKFLSEQRDHVSSTFSQHGLSTPL